MRISDWISDVCSSDLTHRGRSFAPVAGERFDLIVSNPPYVPSPREELPTRGPSRAWEAGLDGRAVLDQLCDEAPGHLVPGGAILLVHSSLIGDDATVERLQRAGLTSVEVIERHRGPLGPLMPAPQEAGPLPASSEEGRVRNDRYSTVRPRGSTEQ